MSVLRAAVMAVLAGVGSWGLSAGRAAEPVPDAAIRAHSYEVLIRRMAHYIHPEVAARVVATLEADRAANLAAPDNAAFMAAVNRDLYAASHDRHLQITLSDGAPPAVEQRGGKYGIGRVERLRGGIVYVELTGFSGQPESIAAVDAAMRQAAGAKALVLDVRDNGGGGQASLLRLLGHLFPRRTELNGIAWRTCANPPGSRPDACVQGPPRLERVFTDQPPRPAYPRGPVYVLTSNRTFSAAEAMAYELKAHDRATIVGERTGGGGNPSAGMDLESAFTVIMPIGKMVKVTRGDGWEGTGVAPDLPAAEAEALNVALAARR